MHGRSDARGGGNRRMGTSAPAGMTRVQGTIEEAPAVQPTHMKAGTQCGGDEAADAVRPARRELRRWAWVLIRPSPE